MPNPVLTAWNDPSMGLTAKDFARWPDTGGLSKVSREKAAPLLQGAADNGDLDVPVYVVGKCATYPTNHGHPAFAGAVEDWTTFAVWGKPGLPWANITTMRSKGLLTKRVESQRLPAFDGIDVEEFHQANGGYVDLQMSSDGFPTARIGFYFYLGQEKSAHEQVRTVLGAITTCREGLLPNGDRPPQ